MSSLSSLEREGEELRHARRELMSHINMVSVEPEPADEEDEVAVAIRGAFQRSGMSDFIAQTFLRKAEVDMFNERFDNINERITNLADMIDNLHHRLENTVKLLDALRLEFELRPPGEGGALYKEMEADFESRRSQQQQHGASTQQQPGTTTDHPKHLQADRCAATYD
jgi:hypothetical protein